MSENQLQRLSVLDALLQGYLTNQEAAYQLNLSTRQIQRIKKEYFLVGPEALFHQNSGKLPANAIDPALRERVLTIYREELAGYNFCHACDVLNQEYQINITRATLDRWLRQEGITSPKAKNRPAKHRSRKPRAHEGEMAQIDASPFDWLSNGTMLHLHGVIDDATGKPLALYLDYQETRHGYRHCMFQMNENATLPQSLYADGRTLFFSGRNETKISHAEALAGITIKETSFARGLQQLGIRLIRAYSPQAKGKVERLWGTLQDRLVKDFQRHGITTIEEANEYLKSYLLRYQDQFAVAAEQSETKYVPSVDPFLISVLFANREFRMLSNGYSLSYQGKKYVIPAVALKKVPDSYLKSVELAIHPDFGIRALFLQYDLVCELQPLEVLPSIPKQKRTMEELSEIKRQAGLKGKANSPWVSNLNLKSKISYEQLSER